MRTMEWLVVILYGSLAAIKARRQEQAPELCVTYRKLPLIKELCFPSGYRLTSGITEQILGS